MTRTLQFSSFRGSPRQNQLRSFRKARPEHRCFAFGLFLGSLVLKHIPVLLENPVLDAKDVSSNPIHSRTTTAEASVNNDVVPFSHDQTGLVLQCGRSAADQIKQAIAARLNVSAILNVVRRPEPLGGRVIAPIESVSNALSTRALFLLSKLSFMVTPVISDLDE